VFETPLILCECSSQKKHTKLEADPYWNLGSDANPDIRESKVTTIYLSAGIPDKDISAVIQYIVSGVLGVEQLLGICCSPSSYAPAHINIALKS
jgi:hypothetical protein